MVAERINVIHMGLSGEDDGARKAAVGTLDAVSCLTITRGRRPRGWNRFVARLMENRKPSRRTLLHHDETGPFDLRTIAVRRKPSPRPTDALSDCAIRFINSRLVCLARTVRGHG